MFKMLVIDGRDGAGKTTLAIRLSKYLHAEYLKFPNEKIYSGQVLRKILNKELPFEPASFQWLQIGNRLETYKTLENGKTYVCDRNKMSGYVYGKTDGLPEEWLREALDFIPDPDLTLVITGKSYKRDSDIYGDEAYQSQISELFLVEAKNRSGRIEIINNEKSIDPVISMEEVFEEAKGKLRGIGL